MLINAKQIKLNGCVLISIFYFISTERNRGKIQIFARRNIQFQLSDGKL